VEDPSSSFPEDWEQSECGLETSSKKCVKVVTNFIGHVLQVRSLVVIGINNTSIFCHNSQKLCLIDTQCAIETSEWMSL
jgi:hypothetical protein